MKFSFSTSLVHIELTTPWFHLYISQGDKDFNRHGFWYGFEFQWSPGWFPTNMGKDFWFRKLYKSTSDFVPYKGLI